MSERPKFPAIGELVPHRPPMLALDRVLDAGEGQLTASMTLTDASLFASGGLIEGSCAIEYMAQAVAASLGMDAYRRGAGVRVGMIIACRQLKLSEPMLETGVEYVVEAECVRGSDSTSMYDTSMRRASGEPVATASMTLVHGEPGAGAF